MTLTPDAFHCILPISQLAYFYGIPSWKSRMFLLFPLLQSVINYQKGSPFLQVEEIFLKRKDKEKCF